MTITLSIDGRDVAVPDGASVLDAVNASGAYISQLCKDPDMKAIGACRTCLVQIDGVRGFPASCSVPATDGMSVSTDTPEVSDIRRGVVELTLGMFPENGDGRGGSSRYEYRDPDASGKPALRLGHGRGSCIRARGLSEH